MPAAIPPGAPPQYYLRGKVFFVPSDSNAATQEQGLSIAVGSPDRMKTELQKDRQRQIFFLSNFDQAWLIRAGSGDAEEYDAKDLADDNALRWLALQFPWPLQDQIEVIEENENQETSEILFQEPGENAPAWKLALGPTGLLRSISEANTDEKTLRLELSEWVAGSSGWLYPKVWIWHYSWGQMEEHFDSFSDESSFLDSWFNPSPSSSGGQNFLNDTTGRISPIRLADQLAVVEQTVKWVEKEDWIKLPDPPAAQEWDIYPQKGEVRQVFTPLDPDAKLPENLASNQLKPDQLWLRWRSFIIQPPRKAAETLRQLAKQNGLKPLGPVWIRNSDANSDRGAKLYLLPVARK